MQIDLCTCYTVYMNQDIGNIKTLILKYYFMQYGEKVDNHDELNFVSNFKNKIEETDKKVYISNRSLKHFVESRKESYTIKHDDKYALSQMQKMFDVVTEIIEYGTFKIEIKDEKERIIFEYDLRHHQMRKHRIVGELRGGNIEIITFHPRS